MKCECGYTVTETPCGDVITVVHCPLHKAAWEMLEALKAVERGQLDDLPPEVEQAIADQVSVAIRKAEGR